MACGPNREKKREDYDRQRPDPADWRVDAVTRVMSENEVPSQATPPPRAHKLW